VCRLLCLRLVKPQKISTKDKETKQNNFYTFYLCCWGWMAAGRWWAMSRRWWKMRLMGDAAPSTISGHCQRSVSCCGAVVISPMLISHPKVVGSTSLWPVPLPWHLLVLGQVLALVLQLVGGSTPKPLALSQYSTQCCIQKTFLSPFHYVNHPCQCIIILYRNSV
jgi:hypothetical protein